MTPADGRYIRAQVEAELAAARRRWEAELSMRRPLVRFVGDNLGVFPFFGFCCWSHCWIGTWSSGQARRPLPGGLPGDDSGRPRRDPGGAAAITSGHPAFVHSQPPENST
jgi:hypothetical protein